MKKTFILLAGAAFVGIPATSWAQSAAGAEAAASESEIIVTAQRRAERIEQVPMTVSVLSSKTIDSAGMVSLRDVSRVVTGVQIAQAGGFPQPAIRGVSTLTNGAGVENNVAVYVDGFYQISAQTINIDLPNVSDIQVLKGPQGTLYGRNATGGAILLNTFTPGKEWKGKMELTYARFDDKRASFYVGGPLHDQIGVSLAAYRRRSDGYVKLASRTIPGETDGNGAPLKQDAVRTKIKADLSETFSATLGFNYTLVSDAKGNTFSALENVAPAVNVPTRPTKLGVVAWDYGAMTQTKNFEYQLTLAWDTSIGTLKSYTGFSNLKIKTAFDFDGSYVNTGWTSTASRDQTYQQGIDFAINAIPNVDLIVGGNYLYDKLTSDPTGGSISWILTPGQPAPSTTTAPGLGTIVQSRATFFRQTKEAYGLFGDLTWHVTPALAVNVGGRYSSEKQSAGGTILNRLTNAVVFPQTTKRAKFSKFTPRGSIRYEIAPRTNIYGSYSKGFRSGAFNLAFPATPALFVPARQENVEAFEVGFKTAGRNFRFELAGFYYDYTDLQVSQTSRDPTCGADPTCSRVVTLVSNAPKAKIKGIEASGEFQPIDNFTIRGGLAWLHARFGNFPNATGVGVNPAALGVNANNDPLRRALNVGQTQDWSGLDMARSPDWTANLGLEYNIPNKDGGLRLSSNINYTSSYVVTNPSVWGPLAGARAREQRFRQKGFTLISAQATWTAPDGHFYAQVYGNNLTDRRYKLHFTGTASFGSYSPMAEPRTFGGRIGYKF